MENTESEETKGNTNENEGSKAFVYHSKIDLGLKNLTPGSMQISRLSAPKLDSIFFASANEVFHIEPSVPIHSEFKRGRQGPSLSAPLPFNNINVYRILNQSNPTSSPNMRHRYEIQSIDVKFQNSDATYRIGSIDSYGFVNVNYYEIPSSLSNKDVQSNETKETSKTVQQRYCKGYFIAPSYMLSSSSSSLSSPSPVRWAWEEGWTGISLHPYHHDILSCCSYFGREVNVFQENKITYQIRTQLPPTQICYMSIPNSQEPLVCICENNMVAAWDTRISSMSPPVQRIRVSSSTLYTMDCDENGTLAVAGEGKIVYVYDARKWKVSGQWSKVMKYEIVSLKLSSIFPNLCYVTGLDHEVFCGSWITRDRAKNLSTLRRHGFRGDSRWIGVDRVPGSDAFVGITETSSLYVITDPHAMCGLDVRATKQKETHPHADVPNPSLRERSLKRKQKKEEKKIRKLQKKQKVGAENRTTQI